MDITTKSVRGNIPIENLYTYGKGLETFFRGFIDGKILTSFCENCNLSYVPCTYFCERCFKELNVVKETKETGYLYSYTIVNINLDNKPLDKPIVAAFIKFPSTHGGLIHYLRNVSYNDLNIGMIVEPHWKGKESRTGSILDIEYFKPVK